MAMFCFPQLRIIIKCTYCTEYGRFRRIKAIQVCEGGFLRCVIKEDIGLTWEFTFSGGNSKCKILTNCNVL